MVHLPPGGIICHTCFILSLCSSRTITKALLRQPNRLPQGACTFIHQDTYSVRWVNPIVVVESDEDDHKCFKERCPLTADGSKEETHECGECDNWLHLVCGFQTSSCDCEDGHDTAFCSEQCHEFAIQTRKKAEALAKKKEEARARAERRAEAEKKKKLAALQKVQEQLAAGKQLLMIKYSF